jgi:hypothetical protein
LPKPFQPAQVFREKFPTPTVFYLLKSLKGNFPYRLMNNYTSESLISHLFDPFKMRNRTISPCNNNTFVNMLEKLFSIFNDGFPCFLMDKNRSNWRRCEKKFQQKLKQFSSTIRSILENSFTNILTSTTNFSITFITKSWPNSSNKHKQITLFSYSSQKLQLVQKQTYFISDHNSFYFSLY